MATIQANKRWNNYSWPKDGEEWADQANFCGRPYSEWKQSIADNFIYPHVNQTATVLEVAPGHG